MVSNLLRSISEEVTGAVHSGCCPDGPNLVRRLTPLRRWAAARWPGLAGQSVSDDRRKYHRCELVASINHDGLGGVLSLSGLRIAGALFADFRILRGVVFLAWHGVAPR